MNVDEVKSSTSGSSEAISTITPPEKLSLTRGHWATIDQFCLIVHGDPSSSLFRNKAALVDDISAVLLRDHRDVFFPCDVTSAGDRQVRREPRQGPRSQPRIYRARVASLPQEDSNRSYPLLEAKKPKRCCPSIVGVKHTFFRW